MGLFKSEKNNNREFSEIVSELYIEKLSGKEFERFVNVVFSLKDKTPEDMDYLFSNFLNMEIDGLTLPMYVLVNNKDLGFNLSPDQIMSMLEKSDLSLSNNLG